MPYKIVKSGKGYKVRKKEKEADGKYKYFSKKPISLKMAKRQIKAISSGENISRQHIKGLQKIPTQKLLRKYLISQLKNY